MREKYKPFPIEAIVFQWGFFLLATILSNRRAYGILEFQNKATSKPPLPDRAFEYFVLSIGKTPAKLLLKYGCWLRMRNLYSKKKPL